MHAQPSEQATFGVTTHVPAGVFTAPEISLQSQLIVDPVLDTAKLVIRDLPADLATQRQIKFIIRSNQGNHPIMREVVYDWATILGL